MSSGFRWLLTGAMTLALATPALAQTTGTITGRVTDRQTQQPLANVQIRIVGTVRGTATDASGTYHLTNVPTGSVQVATQRIGYAPLSRAVSVTSGGTTTADFLMSIAVTTLDEVTVTATGQTERKRENGASVASIDSSSLVKANISTFSDALSSRVPGVVVQQSAGETGAGSRIRIRGSNSISLSNDPLLIIDGVRMDNGVGSTAIGTGGQSPSRFNDINPEEIENIEVIKGPAAAALYGTAASNGVIQVTTKRGRSGKTRWEAFGETGKLTDANTYPLNLRSYGHTAAGGLVTNCNLFRRTSGLSNACVGIDSIASNSPIQSAGILQDGNRRMTGLSAAGGSDVSTYFISGEYQKEQNVVPINGEQRLNLRTNIRSQLTKSLDAQVTVGYLNSDLRRPQNDNNSFGVVSASLLGTAADCSPANTKFHPGLCSAGRDTVSHGYFNPGIDPNAFFNINTRQQVQRLTGGLTSNFTPLSWLTMNATLGADINHRTDTETLGPNLLPTDQSELDGYRQVNNGNITDYTASYNATGTYDYSPTLKFTTTAGTQYTDEGFHRIDAFGAKLLAGTNSLAGTNARFSVGEINQDVRTLGFLGREQIAWADKRFLTLAARTDRNSAFGEDFRRVLYPSVSGSWVLSEESFFPRRFSSVSSLRVRAALGSAGQNPGFLAAEQFFNPVSVLVKGVDTPAFTVGGAGNPELRPEKSTEGEGGFDLGLFHDRLNFEYTHYNKVTKDELVNIPLAPSLGSATNRFLNLGRVRNWGDEGLVRALVFDGQKMKLDMTVNVSTNQNRLEDLGVDANGNPVPQFTSGFDDVQIFKKGQPLGAFYVRQITSVNDANKDGLISCPGGPGTPGCEFTLADSASFAGTPFPKVELSFTPSLTLGKFARINATFDHRGGQKTYNSTAEFRNALFLNGSDVQTPNSGNLHQQAEAQAATFGAPGVYVEDNSFTKLREVAVVLTLPQRVAAKAGAASANLTLAGRNLHTWTKYTGLDPEVSANAQSNFNTADFLTAPQVRYFTVRLALTF